MPFKERRLPEAILISLFPHLQSTECVGYRRVPEEAGPPTCHPLNSLLAGLPLCPRSSPGLTEGAL